MNFVESLELFHVSAKEIPCLTGKGAPTARTEGATGVLYMDIDTGDLYKCRGGERELYRWEIQGGNGTVPVKGRDYYTEADKAEMVAMVLAALGGKVISGYVDAENNIIINDLPDGSYTVRYEMTDGSTVEIGDLVLVSEPAFTNFADPTSADWKTGYRLTNSIDEITALSGGVVTNYITVQTGDTVEVEGIDFGDEVNNRQAWDFGGNYHAIARASAIEVGPSFSHVTYTDTTLTCTVGAPQSESMRMRFSGIPSGTAEDVVIKITRNGTLL